MKTATLGLVLLALGATAHGQSDELAQPIRLTAGDSVIDTGEHIAHAGPLVCDHDGDGVADLLVGNFRGTIQVYRNAGTKTSPRLEAKGLLQADGADAHVENW
jgi:hypothetical protein